MTLVEIINEKSSFNSAAIHTDIRSLNGLCFPIIRRISRSSKIHHVEHCVSSQDTVNNAEAYTHTHTQNYLH